MEGGAVGAMEVEAPSSEGGTEVRWGWMALEQWEAGG
jgi:hypothetical protein